MELPDKNVKYITKEKDEDISNYLWWWRNHQSPYMIQTMLIWHLIFLLF